MPDSITNLGYCAAVCELEAYLCPWDRAELERRAVAYRDEQLRQLAQLEQPVDWNSMTAKAQLKALAFRGSQSAGFGAAAG